MSKMDRPKRFRSSKGLLPSLIKKRNLGGMISSAFTSTKNLVIFRRPPVMKNP
jgi:hypothetical protein